MALKELVAAIYIEGLNVPAFALVTEKTHYNIRIVAVPIDNFTG